MTAHLYNYQKRLLHYASPALQKCWKKPYISLFTVQQLFRALSWNLLHKDGYSIDLPCKQLKSRADRTSSRPCLQECRTSMHNRLVTPDNRFSKCTFSLCDKKAKCTKHTILGPLWDRKSARSCGAKHVSKSKCTKHTMLGPLLEVEMSKKCTPFWREARSKSKCTRHTMLGPLKMWCRKSARCCGAKHVSKSRTGLDLHQYLDQHFRRRDSSCISLCWVFTKSKC